MITGYKNFMFKRQLCKPIQEIKYFGKLATIGNITCMNQQITFRQLHAFVPAMCIRNCNNFQILTFSKVHTCVYRTFIYYHKKEAAEPQPPLFTSLCYSCWPPTLRLR